MRVRTLTIAIIATGAVGATGWLIAPAATSTSAKADRISKPEAAKAFAELADLRSVYNSAKWDAAERSHLAFVAEYKTSAEPSIRNSVGEARLRLGFISAKQGDYEEARQRFIETAALHKESTGPISEFGDIADQAAYQAAACLSAQKKKSEAAHAFKQFIVDYPLSPLVHAAFKRLRVLLPIPERAGLDKLLQRAVDAQDSHVCKSLTSCGPRAIVRALEILKIDAAAVDTIRKQSGTTDKGTTLAGMIKALKAHKVLATGHELNREDFDKLSTPAILLSENHYYVIEEIQEHCVSLYDPMKQSVDSKPLPPLTDPDFHAVVIKISNNTQSK